MSLHELFMFLLPVKFFAGDGSLSVSIISRSFEMSCGIWEDSNDQN